MKLILFPEATKALGKDPDAEYSDSILSVNPLPVWSDGESVVSHWKASWRERLSILIFGRVWLSVLSGCTQLPVTILGSRKFFVSVEARDRLRAKRARKEQRST